MPKLNVIHRLERLIERIAQLENNETIEAREINSLLTNEQKELLKKLWAEQQILRKQPTPKTEEEKKQLGWKTKREVRIDVMEQALLELKDDSGNEMEELMKQSEVKAAKVYLDAYSKAKAEGKNAEAKGNAALQRAGFRANNQLGGRNMDKRDMEIMEMEKKIRNSPNAKNDKKG